MMTRLGLMGVMLLALMVSAIIAGTASAAKPTTFTILDTLGAATPETVFATAGSGGPALNPDQYVGPKFTITEKTTITEIGAFIGGSAGKVQIRPSNDGVPDSSVVIATLDMPTCSAGTVCYVSVNPEKNLKVKLNPGDYFALFVPAQGAGNFSYILGGAQDPFIYQAGLTTMGFLDPTTGVAHAEDQFGAVRILGK